MPEKNYYQILGVSPGATQKEITNAYRKLALKCHPDKNRGNEEWAVKEFQKIQEAYQALANSAPRRKFEFSNKPGSDKFKEFEEMLNEVKRDLDRVTKENQEDLKNVNEEIEIRTKEAIQRMEANFNLAGVSASDLDPSIWAPYSDWRDVIRKDFGSTKSFLIESEMRIAISKAKLKKDNARYNNNSNDHSSQNYNDQKGKYNGKQPNFSDKNFSPNNSGWSGEGKYTPNYTPEYIKAIEEKIEYYKGRLLKTSDEREKQKYQEMMSNLEKELAMILKNQSNNHDQGNQNQDQPPKKSEPTFEQVKSAKDKLEEATKSNNKEEIKNALNEASETVKNSSDPDLKKKKDQAEDKLGQLDPEELRKIIKEEVAKELQKFGMKAVDLSSENKQKLDALNNNDIEPAQTKKIRTEVLTDAAIKVLDKLITEVKQAIKLDDKKKIESKCKELQQFTQNNSEYFQNAYSQKKVEVQQLLEKAKNQFTQNNPPSKFPTGWVVGSGILLVLGLVVILIIKKKRNKNRKY